MENDSQILLYQTDDGTIKIEVHLDDETVWLTQEQICLLFGKAKSTISEHIKHVFEEGELIENSVVRNFRTTAQDGKMYDTNFYNLDVIISVGYRVKSLRGTQFRQWATHRLKEYIIKGFAMNDDLLKQAGGGNYFNELLQRIRDIRSSEKVFWRKVLDIYATSIDYNPKAETTKLFFKTIQNKMHWAAHGHTAAEVVYQRVDKDKPMIGMTSYKGVQPTEEDVTIAKNYLTDKELEILNRMVTAYLEIAEIQALNEQPMYMKDWIAQLDVFLKMTGKDILTNAGVISAEQAKQKALDQYHLYKQKAINELSVVEKNFIAQIEGLNNQLKKK